jgi:hypothetical protein
MQSFYGNYTKRHTGVIAFSTKDVTSIFMVKPPNQLFTLSLQQDCVKKKPKLQN